MDNDSQIFFRQTFGKWDSLTDVKNEIRKKESSIAIEGVADCGKAFFAYALGMLANLTNFDDEDVPFKKFIYIAPNDFAARLRYETFEGLLGEKAILLEPYECIFSDTVTKSREADILRMNAFSKILSGNWQAIVLSPKSLIEYTVSPKILRDASICLKKGEQVSFDSLPERLVSVGYERTPKTEAPGTFSIRGDILDIFPSNEKIPLRIEFFGDEIDTVRMFDIGTQRSIGDADGVTVMPANEFSAADIGQISIIREAIIKSCGENGKNIPDFDAPGTNRDMFIPFIANVCSGKEGKRGATVFDYAKDAFVITEEPEDTEETVETVINEHVMMCGQIESMLPETMNMYMTPEELSAVLQSYGGCRIALRRFKSDKQNEKAYYAGFSQAPSRAELNGKLPMLGNGYKMFAFAKNRQHFPKVYDCLDELVKKSGKKIPSAALVGDMRESFCFDDTKTIVFGCGYFAQAEGEKKKRRTRKKTNNIMDFFAEVRPGDYVVHDIHGIGVFEGVQKLVSDGIEKDYLKILYSNDAHLYVPTYQVGMVEKYIGPEGSKPKINKLGGAEWSKLKEKVKKSLREYAKELIELYALRSRKEGFAFAEDDAWQREFEESFEYEETEDQRRCSEEIKKDMELPRPMERLLCGDVGYGKTEVALRAAFKAIRSGKQVAFLVPTTVLAMQHYNNFRERFKDFGVEVACLCRLIPERERKYVFDGVKSGRIDVLVGTHSILQKKVEFKDLGLLVIDEEQRFGVLHKEKLKSLWPTVDILSLSATPIPRTLNMSLTGIRDISILAEPPSDRVPVQTFVTMRDPTVIKNAIYREMARHGQVFYLCNRIDRMTEKRTVINTLVPEARIAVAHGQMKENELEDIIADFIDGQYDVLLCTTIIESGIDMPNVNTIIVEDGHRLGLAQLYQIRGRVGRSSRRAYAYITVPSFQSVSEEAQKRLDAICEFTEFGSGFKIALRDLEIRGAGSVLGEHQHGKMTQVGYDAYCKLLNEVVCEEQGKKVKTRVTVNVDIKASAYIPESYIEDEKLRLDAYKRISEISSDDDVSDVIDEFVDRYGEPPAGVINLINIAYIRFLAEQAGIEAIKQSEDRVEFVLSAEADFKDCVRRVSEENMKKKFGDRINISGGKNLSVILNFYDTKIIKGKKSIPPVKKKPGDIIREIKEFLLSLR